MSAIMQHIGRVGDHVVKGEFKTGIPEPTSFRIENRFVIKYDIPGQPLIELSEGTATCVAPSLIQLFFLGSSVVPEHMGSVRFPGPLHRVDDGEGCLFFLPIVRRCSFAPLSFLKISDPAGFDKGKPINSRKSEGSLGQNHRNTSNRLLSNAVAFLPPVRSRLGRLGQLSR